MKRPKGWARSAAILAALFVAVTVVNLVFTAQMIRSNNQVRCASIQAEASIPLPQPVAGNPSRVWEAQFEALMAARARQLGCPAQEGTRP